MLRMLKYAVASNIKVTADSAQFLHHSGLVQLTEVILLTDARHHVGVVLLFVLKQLTQQLRHIRHVVFLLFKWTLVTLPGLLDDLVVFRFEVAMVEGVHDGRLSLHNVAAHTSMR